MLPNTDYFELESLVEGLRYAIRVNHPVRYEQEPEAGYPAVFMPDGNMMAHPSHIAAFDQLAEMGIYAPDWVEEYKRLVQWSRGCLPRISA